MNRIWLAVFAMFSALMVTSIDGVAASKYVIKKDPQAIVIAKAAFDAMGGAQAILDYQDSVALGTVTFHFGDMADTRQIAIKSKGLTSTRVEVELPNGMNTRIVNAGQGAISRPDGSVRNLDPNNTFYEHIYHIPLLSLLSEYAGTRVNLLYQGAQQIQSQPEDVIDLEFVPTDDLVSGQISASMSRTVFFVNQSTRLVDKIQRTPFYEGNSNDTFSEEVYLTDYRSVNGLLVPFRQILFVDGRLECDLALTTVTFNVGLSDSDFSLPRVGAR